MSMKTLMPRPLRSVLRRLAWDAVGLTASTASGMELRIASPSDWFVFNEIFVKGEYDSAIGTAFDGAFDRLNVLDLGANVGFFSLRVLDLLHVLGRNELKLEIVAVEGSPRYYRELATRLDEVGVNGGVRPILGLVGKRSGQGIICETDFGARSSIVRTEEGDSASVRYVDLEAVLAPDTRIDLLKCDIEGAEELFIENYPQLLRHTRVAAFELHDTLCDTDRCRTLLNEAGLTMRHSTAGAPGTVTALFVRDR
jgi:FkbM family methyltransferase